MLSWRQLSLHLCTARTPTSLLPEQARSEVIHPFTNATYAIICYAAGSMGHWSHCLLFPHKKFMTVSAVFWSPFQLDGFHAEQARTEPWRNYVIRSIGFSSTSGRIPCYTARLMSLHMLSRQLQQVDSMYMLSCFSMLG